jgi:hypothetical protein
MPALTGSVPPAKMIGIVDVAESVNDACRLISRSRAEPTNHRHRRRLPARRERPGHGYAAE